MLACRIAGWLGVVGIVATVLAAGGCGCTDDSYGPSFQPVQQVAQAQVGLLVPPIEVPPPQGAVKVDVMFLLDDSFFVTQRTVVPGQNLPIGAIPGDGRIKTDVAQDVFADAVARLLDRLVADGLGQPEDFDLAFGVSRFEDYANFARSMQLPAGGPAPAVDGTARPFILNQPILRQAHPLFDASFAAALARETPGDGGAGPQDPQAALEALYQLATGAGFDGNGNGSTTESGPVGVLSTQLNPGTSGDVPAFAATPAAADPDGEPSFLVGGSIASGNQGGAGWRPDAVRLVVLFTDVTTVAPLLAGVTPDPGTGLFVYPVPNTPSPAGQGPRPAETIDSVQAFAPLTGTPAIQRNWRFGPEDGAPAVAPPGAATVESVVDALNEMDVEVLGISLTRRIEGGPTKPNLPGPTLPGEIPAVQDPKAPPSNLEAFTFLSAIAILSGARDTDATDADPRFVPGLPLVYNLTTVAPSGEAITDDLVEDLADRVGAWIPYKQTGSTDTEPGSAFFDFTLAVTNPNAALLLSPDPGFPLVPDVDPGGSDPIYVSQTGATQRIRIPCYFQGDAPPASVRVAFQLGVQRADSEDLAERLTALGVTITPVLAPASSVPGGENPTGPTPVSLVVDPLSAAVAVVFPEVADPANPPTATSTLATLATGAALFRDVGREIPAGTSIFTMAGPLTAGDLPYPAIAP